MSSKKNGIIIQISNEYKHTMGTNYYLKINDESYHLGKSSAGWKFFLNIIMILRAILDNLNLDDEERETIREVRELIYYYSTNLKYDSKTGELWPRDDVDYDIVNKHKWFLNYTDIFVSDTAKQSVYVLVDISVITKGEFISYLRNLLEIEGSSIVDEYDKEWTIDEFINLIEQKTGLDLVSYYSDSKYNHYHWMSMNVEYKIGNLRCSSHAEFY